MQAGEALGVGEDLRLTLARDGLHLEDAVGQRHGGLHRVGQALAQLRPHDQTVHDDRDVVLVLLVQHDLFFELAQLAVHLHAREALGPQLGQLLAVLALAAAHDRRHDHEPRALFQAHDLVDDLLRRLRGDRPAAVEAVRLADPRPEQAQVVVDLRDRADRGARVARRGLLVDRDGRRQALDGVHVRLVHLPQELARVRGQRLHVAALALGVDGVEGERGLARAGQAGDDHERVSRQLDGDVLEVVLAGAGDDDGVLTARHKTASHSTAGPDVLLEQMFARSGERGPERSANRRRAACPRDTRGTALPAALPRLPGAATRVSRACGRAGGCCRAATRAAARSRRRR